VNHITHSIVPVVFVIIGSLAGPAFATHDGETTSSTSRGQIVGNGVNLPREIANGKTPEQRSAEIWRWMTTRGARESRFCDPKNYGGCRTTLVLALTDSSELFISEFTGPNRQITYCRSNTYKDTIICYSMLDDSYFLKVRDSKNQEWVSTWDEREQKRSSAPLPSKPADVQLGLC
jgi:hypothetical protein